MKNYKFIPYVLAALGVILVIVFFWQSAKHQQFIVEQDYKINLPAGWDLAAQDLERSVDRYRFEKDGAIFTISVYDKGDITSFDALTTRRYGSAFISSSTDTTINGLPARKLDSNFLQPDSQNEYRTVDMLVQVGENKYFSLYALYITGENKELDQLQNSFTKLNK